MLPDSKVVDAAAHKISIGQTVGMARIRACWSVHLHSGFHVDTKIAGMMKDSNPS